MRSPDNEKILSAAFEKLFSPQSLRKLMFKADSDIIDSIFKHLNTSLRNHIQEHGDEGYASDDQEEQEPILPPGIKRSHVSSARRRLTFSDDSVNESSTTSQNRLPAHNRPTLVARRRITPPLSQEHHSSPVTGDNHQILASGRQASEEISDELEDYAPADELPEIETRDINDPWWEEETTPPQRQLCIHDFTHGNHNCLSDPYLAIIGPLLATHLIKSIEMDNDDDDSIPDLVDMIDVTHLMDFEDVSNDDIMALAMAEQLPANLYDCLLYTSPSPRDGLLSRMPSSA